MIQYQILQASITRTIWQTVRRITNEILGVKELRNCKTFVPHGQAVLACSIMLLQKNFCNDKFLESSHTTYVEILKIFLTWCQSSDNFVFKSINRYKVIFHNLLLVAFSLVKYK